MTSSQKRIAIALLIGAVLITGALFLRTDNKVSSATQQEVAVVAKAPERKAIKTLDENENGIPDWQEALVTGDPLELPTDNIAYEAPDTLTEQFALEFFQDMVRAENYGVFGASPEELVGKASDELISQVNDTLLGVSDVNISSDTSIESLNAYGQTIAEITTRYQDTSTENEAVLLERALREQDENILTPLDGKISVYEKIIHDTQVLPVPEVALKQHLDLLNSYQAVLNDIIAMRNAFDDPMLALLRMKRYQDDAIGLNAAFKNLYTTLQKRGASWEAGSPVFLFIQ